MIVDNDSWRRPSLVDNMTVQRSSLSALVRFDMSPPADQNGGQ